MGSIGLPAAASPTSSTGLAGWNRSCPWTGLGLGGAGRLLLADIGIPPVLYSRHLGIEDLTVFSQGDIVDVTRASLRPVP